MENKDTFLHICSFLNLKDLINLELTCNKFKQIIRKEKFQNMLIHFRYSKNILSCIQLHNFSRLNLNCSDIDDIVVEKLINCTELRLSFTRITDNSVQKLVKCKYLELYGTKVSTTCKNMLKSKGVNVFCENNY